MEAFFEFRVRPGFVAGAFSTVARYYVAAAFFVHASLTAGF
jgi:hypothetical protein